MLFSLFQVAESQAAHQQNEVRILTIERAIASLAFQQCLLWIESAESISSQLVAAIQPNNRTFTNMIGYFVAPFVICTTYNVSFDFRIFCEHFISEWVGDLDSENAGRLGLWQVCQRDETSDNCQKQLTDFLSIPSIPFQVIIFLFGRMSLQNFYFFFNNNLTISCAPSFRCHLLFNFNWTLFIWLVFSVRNAFVSFLFFFSSISSFYSFSIGFCETRWQQHSLDYRLWQLCSQFYF